jgi:beta-phosphoglucomutase-like phosphatase (HAD superfamily)
MDAVIFDWDGTLIDSLPIFYRANAAVMALYGLPFDESAYRRPVAADWRQMYTGLGLTVDQLDEANGAHEVADSVLAWVTRLLSQGARTEPPIRRVGPGLLERVEPGPAG